MYTNQRRRWDRDKRGRGGRGGRGRSKKMLPLLLFSPGSSIRQLNSSAVDYKIFNNWHRLRLTTYPMSCLMLIKT
jgi:hypothetical protein